MNRWWRFLSVALVAVCVFAAPLAAEGAKGAADFQKEGLDAMLAEDWYTATEAFLEALRVNPHYAESVASLAECYYQLGEFDQALLTVRRARALSRSSTGLENLEAFILIALGRLDEADKLVRDALSREPYNRESLFAAAELSLARGRVGEAAAGYREAVRRYPDDRRALLSLALVTGSIGDLKKARSYAERAVEKHPDDARCHYYLAYLDAEASRLDEAASGLTTALNLRADFTAARSLLAQVRYRQGNWEEASRLADILIQNRREDSSAWYIKGLSLAKLGKAAEARTIFSQAVGIDPADEFSRAALEDLTIKTTAIEAAERSRLAAWHLERARDFKAHNYIDQALFEYRRALRINPYAKERSAYADLLRALGYPERQLSELRFLQETGKADRAVNDAVETYDSLLADALYRRWKVDPVDLQNRHWKIAVVSLKSDASVRHVDAASLAVSFISDLLVHDGHISLVDIGLERPSFASAFKAAREAKADYFLILSASEGERDLTLSGQLYVARTGSAAASFSTFRTGPDRLRNASRRLIDDLDRQLPFKGELVSRKSGLALLDAGKSSGVVAKQVYEIVRQGALQTKSEGVGLSYDRSDVLGTLTIDEVDEEVAQGSLQRNGFFDRVAAGDHVVLAPAGEKKKAEPKKEAESSDAELQAMLRSLR